MPRPWSPYWILDAAGEPVRCDDVIAWGEWFATAARHVAHDVDEGATPAARVCVSTVFLGLDHNWRDEGPPVLWETLITGGPYDGQQERYTSRDAAFAGPSGMVPACGGGDAKAEDVTRMDTDADRDTLDQLARELLPKPPMEIAFRPETVLQLVGLVQLACRHPALPPPS